MSQTAVVAGVGPGLGASLVKKLAREGCRVGMFARSTDYLQALTKEMQQAGFDVLPVAVDITDPDQVASGFQQVRDAFGPVDILVNHASGAVWKGLLDLSPAEFEQAWRACCYGAFLCSREAVADMLATGSGAVLFTGATSSIRGRAGALDFSSAKFAMRGLADAMAREYWSHGIHVAHIVVDGIIGPPANREHSASDEPMLDPDAMADAYWALIQQDKSAWTLELDLRPHGEAFFE